MNIYTRTARFDGEGRALTEDELHKLAPSIFATQAHESRSTLFKPIPTIDVLRDLAKEGFYPVGVKQAVARQPGRADYTKHLIRLRHLGDEVKHNVGGTVFEMLLKNANDGTSAYDLMGGLFRILCMNSMVSEISTVDTLRVRHTGDTAAKVVEGTYRVLQTAERALTAPQDWPKIMLEDAERQAFAESAHQLRFADAEGKVTTPVVAEQLLFPRRLDDREHDLWKTFNVVQENAMKGGLTGVKRDPERHRMRRVTTRAVKGIDQDVRLNRALWTLAARMAEIKQAA